MAFQDSNPERRNLVVTSVAFIAYYYGGGELANNSISLPVVSIRFANTGFIAAMAWAALFWFLYRYWLLHSGEFVKNFASEVYSYHDKPYIERYAAKRTGRRYAGDKDDSEEGVRLRSLVWGGGCLRAPYSYITNIRRNKNTGAVESYTSATQGEIRFTDLHGWLIALVVTASCFFRKPSFSNYLMPYLVFVVAVFGLIYRYLS